MTTAAEKWVALYRAAWESNQPDDIRAVFTDDAVYKGRPDDPEPVVGLEAIIADWVENPETGPWSFEYEVLGTDGDLAFIQGRTDYPEQKSPVYFNLWVVRLAEDGRASEFTEWFMEPRKSA